MMTEIPFLGELILYNVILFTLWLFATVLCKDCTYLSVQLSHDVGILCYKCYGFAMTVRVFCVVFVWVVFPPLLFSSHASLYVCVCVCVCVSVFMGLITGHPSSARPRSVITPALFVSSVFFPPCF